MLLLLLLLLMMMMMTMMMMMMSDVVWELNLEEKEDFVFDKRHVVLHWQRCVDQQVDYILDDSSKHLSTSSL